MASTDTTRGGQSTCCSSWKAASLACFVFLIVIMFVVLLINIVI